MLKRTLGKDAGSAWHKSTLVCLGLLAATMGCEGQPLSFAEDSPQTTRQNAGQAADQDTAPDDMLTTRVLRCKVVDKAESSTQTDWFAYYAVDSMTRMLDKYPSLAAYTGLSSVSSCEEAIAYARAYDEYAAAHPDFELAPDPMAESRTRDAASRPLLPRLKVRGGQPDNYYDFADGQPSPVVGIVPVYWLARYSSYKFTTINGERLNEFCEPVGICTATFLNKYWLLTAAHCMQNVTKQAVRYNPSRDGLPFPYCLNADGTQPQKSAASTTRKGQTSWLIFWSSKKNPVPRSGDTEGSHPYNEAWPNLYMGTRITGVQAYQHPHPKYVASPPPADKDGYQYDIALLGLDPSSNPEAFLPRDIVGQGGTVYLKAYSLTDPPNQPFFRIDGYGSAADGNGNANGNDQRLNWARATLPFDLDKYLYTAVISSAPDSTGFCEGDSGGPLSKVYTGANGVAGPQRFVQYGVASHHAVVNHPEQDCHQPGDKLRWVRLEADDEKFHWIEQEMGTRTFEGKKFSPCVDFDDPMMGKIHQCWGQLCGDRAGKFSCPSGKVCLGGATDLKTRRVSCTVCPGKPGNCDCVVGQCVDDVGKSTQPGTGTP